MGFFSLSAVLKNFFLDRSLACAFVVVVVSFSGGANKISIAFP